VRDACSWKQWLNLLVLLTKMTQKDYKLELLAAIENSRGKDALTVTREFMAQKALDDLYQNNAEGMKRLANS